METKTTVSSKQFQINWSDFLRGLLLSVIFAVLTFVETSMEAGNFVFDWKTITKVAGLALVSYLIKNYFTPATVKQVVTNAQVDEIKSQTETENTAK